MGRWTHLAVVGLLSSCLVSGYGVVSASSGGAVEGASVIEYHVPGTYQWTVPGGVNCVAFSVAGGEGGTGSTNFSLVPGGHGGLVTGGFAVTAGEVFTLDVGGSGADGTTVTTAPGGLGGGGNGGRTYAGGGGGRSVVSHDGSAFVIAGGGGGGGGGENDPGTSRRGGTGGDAGSAGGNATDANADGNFVKGGGGGGAGGSVAGGAGGLGAVGDLATGNNGEQGGADTGGTGADGLDMVPQFPHTVPSIGGGGGGGGLFGGGGGGSGAWQTGPTSNPGLVNIWGASGGGGGGSSLVPPGGTFAVNTHPFPNLNGYVIVNPGGCAAVQLPCGASVVSTSAGTLANLTNQPVPASPPSPAGVTFPCGLISFDITDLTAGGSATVTLALPQTYDQYWKLQGGSWTRITGASFGPNVVTMTLTDGGVGDADGTANGVIHDPGGPAAEASEQPPTDATAAPEVIVPPNFAG